MPACIASTCILCKLFHFLLGSSCLFSFHEVMFKTRAAVFYWDLKRFTPNKTHAVSFSNGFKNIPGKAFVKRVHNNNAFVDVGN